METVQNAAASAQSAASTAYTTASKLIFGESQTAESGTEPVSGEQGQGTTTSPFDQGNRDDGTAAGQSTITSSTGGLSQKAESGQEPLSGVSGLGTVDEPFDQGNKVDGAAAGQSTSTASSAPLSSGTVGGGLATTTSSVGGTDSSTPAGDGLGANKPLDVPIGGQQNTSKAWKEEAEEAILSKDPGTATSGPTGTNSTSGIVVDNTASGGNDLSGESIKANATGDQYAKSTGLAADGGNFDATKPGAGAEATRLLEKQSVEKEDHGASKLSQDAGGSTSVDEGKTKPKLSERIKDKLHIHKH